MAILASCAISSCGVPFRSLTPLTVESGSLADEYILDRYIQELATAPKPPQEEESPPPFVLSVREPGSQSWEYRVPVPMLVITAVGIATPLLGGAYSAGMNDDDPAALRVLLPVLAIAALGLFLWSARRSGTYVSRDGKELKPHQLRTRNFFVEQEVHELHASWKERRGPRWKPIREVVALMRDGTLT